jgi:hypothetical protein
LWAGVVWVAVGLTYFATQMPLLRHIDPSGDMRMQTALLAAILVSFGVLFVGLAAIIGSAKR